MLSLTVSIPTYNRSGYLQEAIESVLAQTYSDFILLITDNGSTDGTQEIVQKYVNRDSRIIYHRFSKNQGPAENWKYALLTPNTDLVALLLDDDLLLPEHLEHAVIAMTEFNDASLYCCKTEAFGDLPTSVNNTYCPLWLADRQTITEYDARQNSAPLLMGTPMAVSGLVFKGHVLRSIPLYWDSAFAPGDYFLMFQMSQYGTIVYEPVVFARYRWHSENHSVKIQGTRRASAQLRYLIRKLALMALKEKTLDLHRLEDEAMSWPVGSLSNLIVAFAVVDAPLSFRKLAFRLFKRRSNDIDNCQTGRHYQVALRTGVWYLLFADMIDRATSGWWKPKWEPSVRH